MRLHKQGIMDESILLLFKFYYDSPASISFNEQIFQLKFSFLSAFAELTRGIMSVASTSPEDNKGIAIKQFVSICPQSKRIEI